MAGHWPEPKQPDSVAAARQARAGIQTLLEIKKRELLGFLHVEQVSADEFETLRIGLEMLRQAAAQAAHQRTL